MNELVTAQTFVLGSALIVAAFLTLEWVETRRTRAISRRHRDRIGAAPTATTCERAIIGSSGHANVRDRSIVERRPDRHGVSDRLGVAMTRLPSSEVAPVTTTRSPDA